MTKTLGDYLILIISIFGSLASIIAFGTVFAPQLDNQGWIGVLFLGILTLFFLGYNFYLVLHYRKKVRYASIFEEINLGFTHLHKIDRENIQNEKEIGHNLIFMCDSISNAFSKINGHYISTCIKFLSFENERPKVQTLVRDRKSSINNRKSGKEDIVKHWLDGNSDFDFIYSNFDNDAIDTSCYYEKKLPVRKNYRNTRLVNWSPKSIPVINNIVRRATWPLKYRSTIVVPIIPLRADEQNQKALRGFLCIDSPRNIAFNKHIDVEILKGISDGLYKQIDTLHKLVNSDNDV